MNPAFLAALFTSSLALLGLTVGKDSKVSEFRQQWIDGLRADVSEYLASVQHVFGFRVIEHYKGQDADHKVSADERYRAMQRTSELGSRIRLRLAPEKPLSKELTAAMKRLQHIAHDSSLIETDLLLQVQVVETCTSALLDEAWKRVKSGERKYRVCIWISGVILGLSVVAVIAPYIRLL